MFSKQDQVDHLAKLKIRAETINSKIGVKERKRILAELGAKNPDTKLLYITPEQAATEFFRVNSFKNSCFRFRIYFYFLF